MLRSPRPRGSGKCTVSHAVHLAHAGAPSSRRRWMTCCTSTSGAEAPAVRPTRRPADKPGALQVGGPFHHVGRRAQALRQFAQAVAVAAGGAAHHDDHIHRRRHQLDGVLPVLRGVADVLLLGFAHVRKAALDLGQDLAASSTLSVVCVTTASLSPRGLDVAHVFGHVFDQVDAFAQLAHRAFDLGVPLVADHDELVAFLGQLGHFHVHLGDQRAGGVEDLEAQLRGFARAPPG
jgi:hypothetical protein